LGVVPASIRASGHIRPAAGRRPAYGEPRVDDQTPVTDPAGVAGQARQGLPAGTGLKRDRTLAE